ncbi:hypothetical protein Rhow_005669 [Rhodococcus wratislaviensis]|uniref:Uncharacterized protein n=1 Tax=Rhodococcus wratislaviensis TaxID=44752 RepID=A0A402CEH7_RHOWR|nr:hypothetical protein Rhow_005669 [Rhodococcus wratislaviensis]
MSCAAPFPAGSGHHRDCQVSVVALGALRVLSARAGTTDGENGFIIGLL